MASCDRDGAQLIVAYEKHAELASGRGKFSGPGPTFNRIIKHVPDDVAQYRLRFGNSISISRKHSSYHFDFHISFPPVTFYLLNGLNDDLDSNIQRQAHSKLARDVFVQVVRRLVVHKLRQDVIFVFGIHDQCLLSKFSSAKGPLCCYVCGQHSMLPTFPCKLIISWLPFHKFHFSSIIVNNPRIIE